jgi:hypothetical protein
VFKKLLFGFVDQMIFYFWFWFPVIGSFQYLSSFIVNRLTTYNLPRIIVVGAKPSGFYRSEERAEFSWSGFEMFQRERKTAFIEAA